jgi:hypothetical protein
MWERNKKKMKGGRIRMDHTGGHAGDELAASRAVKKLGRDVHDAKITPAVSVCNAEEETRDMDPKEGQEEPKEI